MPLLDIRPATPGDVDAIARIHVASWRAAYTGLIDKEALAVRTVERRTREWRERLTGESGAGQTFYVARESDAVVGFASAGPSDDDDVDPETTVNVYSLYLDPEMTGRGIGSALLAHVLDDFSRRGFTLATLYVLDGNTQARRFYERAGWALDPGAVKECLGDGYQAPQVRYRLSLDARG
jgi:ribosomal protein S18 acetylase RimI-like enzyme